MLTFIELIIFNFQFFNLKQNNKVENYEEVIDCEKIEETALSKEKSISVTISK